MDTHEFKSAAEARQWATAFVPNLKRPCVVLLSGDLGAGKTQFVRWFLEVLGSKDTASPTFAIHNEYNTPGGPADHVDIYRVQSEGDLESSGFWDLFAQDAGLVFVEWADRLPEDMWPANWTRIFLQLDKLEGEARRLRVRIFKPNAPK